MKKNVIKLLLLAVCCANLKKLVNDKEKCKIHRLEYCFELFTNKDIISHFINENLYLVTPGWLKNWEKNSDALGFTKESKKIRLLDTGIYEGSLKKLQKFAEYVNLPYDSFFVGLDFFRMFIEKIILEWRLECEKSKKILI